MHGVRVLRSTDDGGELDPPGAERGKANPARVKHESSGTEGEKDHGDIEL
jgi:hypothetical protein